MASPFLVKISYETTTKQIAVGDDFGDLRAAVTAEFPALNSSADWQLTMVDAEGDTLLVDSDNSFKSALAVASGVPRFTVARKGSPAAATPASAQVPTPPPAASASATPTVPSIADLLPLLSAAGITPQAAQRMAATFLPMAAQAFTQAPGAASGGAAALGDLLRTVLGSGANGTGPATAPAPAAPVNTSATEETREAPAAATHTGVQCDGCGMNPIVGAYSHSHSWLVCFISRHEALYANYIALLLNSSDALAHQAADHPSPLPSLMTQTGTRYKDGSRIDFDLCSSCEASSAGENSGPYLKITTPDKAPALLICVPRGGHAPPGMWGRCGGGRGGRGAWRRAAHRQHQQQQYEQQQQQQQQQEEATAPAAAAAAAEGATTDTGAQTSSSFASQMEQAIHASLTTAAPAATTDETTVPTTTAEGTTEATTEASTEATIEEPAVTESAAADDDSAITAAAAAGATTGDNFDSEYDILETTPLLEETATATTTTTSADAVLEESTTTTTTAAAITEQQQQQRAKRWQKEIVSLASMGFVDFALNLDLLEQHVGTPGGAGMDKVLDQLLSA
jgi:hypothetical protein